MPRAALLLLACVAGVHPYSLLRDLQDRCALGHYGSSLGAAQRLVVTHLTPGVADWNIAVPMPPMCKNGRITGVDTTVCDSDVPPEVTMQDLVSARVHRKGELKSYATVNVTVYCVLPLYSEPADAKQTDAQSTDEALSTELISNEEKSNEAPSTETVSSGLTSKELKPNIVNPITPEHEVTTPQTEQITSPEQVTLKPTNVVQAGEAPPPSYKVTIKITPPSKEGKKKRRQHSHKHTVPSVSNKEKLSPLQVGTPPRNSMLPPQHPGMPPQPIYAEHNIGEAQQYPGPRPPYAQEYGPASAEAAPGAPGYGDMPPVYNMLPPPMLVAPLYRPVGLMGPRLRFWLDRKPSLLLRHA